MRTSTPYDVFFVTDNDQLWIGAAASHTDALQLLKKSAGPKPGAYLVYCQDDGKRELFQCDGSDLKPKT